MRARLDGVGEDELSRALAEGWGIEAAAMRYAAVGAGSYHWVVREGATLRRPDRPGRGSGPAVHVPAALGPE